MPVAGSSGVAVPQLEVAPPSLELDAGFDASIGFSAGDLNLSLVTNLGANIEAGWGLQPGKAVCIDFIDAPRA